MTNNNIIFSICSFVYIVLICIIYFSKKRLNNIENKIYSTLIITNLIGLIIEISGSFFTNGLGYSFLQIVSLRLINVYFLTWLSIFTYYVFIISVDINKLKERFARINTFVICGFFILLLLVLILPLNIQYEGGYIVYTYGPSVMFLYGVSFVYVLICFILLLFNIKRLGNKKYLPLITFFVLGVVTAIVQMNYPELIILSSMESFVTVMMYHTIENPDMKMVQALEIARESADRANNSKTEFLSSMSHEIRTPLNAIVGFSDCIVDANNLVEAKENAKDIVNASQTLLEIVNGILDISKIEAGKMEIVNTKYNAREVFTEVAKLITPRMKEKGLDFTYMIDPNLPATLFGDKANLKKIVTNFLSNACKYTDRGFVRYEVHCVKLGEYCRLIISVEDSGRGIKKDSVDKLFNRFQRVDEDRNTTIEGTGLGLAITKQLTELMGGKVIVHTVFGQGSKFTAVINQKIESMNEVEETVVHTELNLTDVRILIVDDAPLNLKVATKLMQKYGANNIDTCMSGFECIRKIQEGEKYDLIFMDDMMPKMSGIETFSKLKQTPHFHTPTIALTANAITGMREKYLSVGFNDYLAKPMDQMELIRVCNELLGREDTTSKIVVPVEETEEEKLERTAVIPVPENIEQLIGDAAQMEGTAVVEEKVKEESIETLEETPETEPETTPMTVPLIEVEEINLPPLMESSTENSTTAEVYDRNYLEKNGVDVNKALEMLGDMDMYNATVHDFVSEVEEKWKRIESNLESGNMSDYSIDVHSLKSDCKYLGFMPLADIAYDHELKSKENNYEYVKEHFEELREGYNKYLDIAKKYASNNPVN
ncbi:MAG: response regulator [Bacilli bacterium]|nr:response regulator [Bacilli bacterium]